MQHRVRRGEHVVGKQEGDEFSGHTNTGCSDAGHRIDREVRRGGRRGETEGDWTGVRSSVYRSRVLVLGNFNIVGPQVRLIKQVFNKPYD